LEEANHMSIKEKYTHELAEVVAKALASGSRESLTASDGTEVYAYDDGVFWGINRAGNNVLHGIRLHDGSDIAEGS
jgi:hypothetical protein